MATVMEKILILVASLIPAVETSIGLGELGLLLPQGATAGGNVFSVSTTADVDALLTATNITADGAAAAKTALNQSIRGTVIRIVTYVTTAVDTALALLQAQVNWNIGVISIRGLNDVTGDLADVASFVADNPFKYYFYVESPNTGLKGAGQPAALNALELPYVAIPYVTAAVSGKSPAAGAGSILAAKQLIGAAGGPAAARMRILDIDTPVLTSSEAQNIIDNFAMAVQQLDAGNSATERVMLGTKSYSGDGLTPVVSMIYAIKQIRAYLGNFILSKAITDDAILNTEQGKQEVMSVIDAALAPMVERNHFVPNESYPLGYKTSVSVVNDTLSVTVTVRLPQEIKTFNVSFVGIIT